MKRFIYISKSIMLVLIVFSYVNLFSAEYCIPPFFDTYGADPFTGITKVELNGNPGLAKSSLYNDKYIYYKTATTSGLQQGKEYTVKVDVFTSLGNKQNSRVWIDWNQDKDFDDADEMVAAWNDHPQGLVEFSFKVPLDAKTGLTRMRVFTEMNMAAGHIMPEPCGYLNHSEHFGHHGNVEDYNINVSAGNYPVITTDVSSLDYGSVSKKQAKELTFEIENTGNSQLVISTFSFDFNDDKVFTLKDSKTPLYINAGMKKTITVIFTPKSINEYFSILNIKSNAANNQKITIDLSGNGIGEGPVLALSDTLLDFQETIISKEKQLVVEISNQGETDLEISKLELINEPNNAFHVGNYQIPLVIKPGASKEIKVTFKPTSEKTYSSDLEISSNSAESHRSLNITGIGVKSKPVISLNFESIDFGKNQVNKTKQMTINIKNTGNDDLVITNAELNENSANAFSIVPLTFPIKISPEETKDLIVHFNPLELKEYQSSLLIESNSVNMPEKVIPVYGIGEGTSIVEIGGKDIAGIKVEIFPNPLYSAGKIFINYENKELKIHSIKIYDIASNEIAVSNSVFSEQGNLAIDFDAEKYPVGVYFIIMLTDKGIIETSFIINR